MNLTKELLIEHARKHGMFIHPFIWTNIDEWVKTVNALGHCPCSPNRPQCPCPQSIEEVKNGKRNACTCTALVGEKYIGKYAYALGLTREDFFKPGP